ncbi:hypothetical protein ASD24_26600 [Paenibacillus sp. Root52]|uniref:helix-turn-helix domain-containing protein n=1 Tax=Paenibacillus sp. Root52 TaxID=1736552 RepID=UPI0006F4D85A|nr:XRE family transcriptional regulator [Paenibacillus sp. Root52]KQY87050.1 hypothetical protein ASD24_26600 [Paenibacillus sp. Root52]
MSVSEKLSELIKEKGLSVYRISKDTGIPYTTVTQIVNGKTKSPRFDLLKTLAEYLGESVDTFASSEENEEHESPDWATAKDMRDFKKMLEEDEPVMFDGVPMSTEDKEKVKRIMEALFWEAKELNKKTYGRKKKD